MRPDRMRIHRPTTETATPAWMVTYADMVTLLLCLFVGLLSMSSIKPELFQSALGSVQGAFGSPGHGPVDRSSEPSLFGVLGREIPELQPSENAIGPAAQIDWAVMTRTPQGVAVRLSGAKVFDGQGSVLQVDAIELAMRLADVVADQNVRIKISGFSTGEMPARSEERNLSYRRGAAVAEVLEKGGVPARMIGVEGLADVEPLLPHAYTEERRAFNRGVLISIEVTD